ncbi:TrkA family potassium uptake protein [Bacillus sp. V5-8f]|uniref:potassium channel family protein n=1 Tax=Bacillus sp. V5-8f TaxID=2053044 RepID=UPI0015E12812|nr:potassium channel family protein [Bacillus sp. V5-8f]
MLRIKNISRGFPNFPRITRLLVIIFFFLFSFGMVIHLAEPDTFHNLFDGIWWAVVTISTVGYGDLAPTTVAGKVIAIILILTGAGLLTSYFAALAAVSVSSEQSYMEGKMDYNRTGQIIIVGWNERSKEIIRELGILQPYTAIVLIDDSLETHPIPKENVHFIRGKAITDLVLQRANIKSADKVLITADLRQDEAEADMFSIITLLAVKGCRPDIFSLVEILTKEQIENAFRAGADGIIETNRFASELMVQSLLHRFVPEFQMDGQLRKNIGTVTLKSIQLRQEWQGLTFSELHGIMLEADMIAVGIEREGKRIIKPSWKMALQMGDRVFIVNQD